MTVSSSTTRSRCRGSGSTGCWGPNGMTVALPMLLTFPSAGLSAALASIAAAPSRRSPGPGSRSWHRPASSGVHAGPAWPPADLLGPRRQARSRPSGLAGSSTASWLGLLLGWRPVDASAGLRRPSLLGGLGRGHLLRLLARRLLLRRDDGHGLLLRQRVEVAAEVDGDALMSTPNRSCVSFSNTNASRNRSVMLGTDVPFFTP